MAFTEFLVSKRERGSWIAEASFGAGGTMASGEVIGYNWAMSPNFSQSWQEYLTAGADNLWVQGRQKGPLKLPYGMSFVPYNWRWFKYIMAVADGIDGATKTHTFTQSMTIASWAMEWAKRHTTNHVITTVGNFCKSATIAWRKATGEGTEGFIKVNMACVAQDLSQGSSVTSLSNISNAGFQYRMCKVTMNSNEITEINNGEMTIDRGINESEFFYANTTADNLMSEPAPGTMRISGRYNINLKDKTQFDFWNNAVVVPGTNTLLFDRDGTGNDQILFTFTNFYVHAAVAATNPDFTGVTNVDVIWTADSVAAVARDLVSTY